VAIFTTNVDVENQTLINHKTVCGALNRHFCQTPVTSCPSSSVNALSCRILQCPRELACKLFCIFLFRLVRLQKMKMCLQLGWQFEV
jgi:hypothetical protein